MRLTTDRVFRFPFPPDDFWTRISVDVDQYTSWWPWLRSFDGVALRAGEVWSCTVRPPLPYPVRFAIGFDDIVPGRSVRARITGDIVGCATLSVDQDGQGCRVRLTSDLRPRKRSLRILSVPARPLLRFGHNWILDVGLRQFEERSGPDRGRSGA